MPTEHSQPARREWHCQLHGQDLMQLAADVSRAQHPMNKEPGNFCQTFELADWQRRTEQDLWALRQLEDAEKYLAEDRRLKAFGTVAVLRSDIYEQAEDNYKAALAKLDSVKDMLANRVKAQ